MLFREPELILVGTGALAREVIEAHAARRRVDAELPRIRGLVDDEPVTNPVAGYRVLGRIEALWKLCLADPWLQLLLCLADPHRPGIRLAAADVIAMPPSRFATVVHPAAILASSTRVGPGSVILANVTATADVHIGAHVVVMPGTVLSHDNVVGDGASIAAGVRLSGGVEVGEGAYLGAGALVREGVRIGARAVVGMGAVVLRDVPAGEVWVGNPARRLRAAQPPHTGPSTL